MADGLIGALAKQKAGIITRNPTDFSLLLPQLRV
jgi:hypothetical protein